MILKPGDPVLVVHRRLFDNDKQRFFVGTVEACEEGLASVNGYSFARENVEGSYARKSDAHAKIVSLSSGSLITYRLPRQCDVDAARIVAHDGRLVLSDGRDWEMGPVRTHTAGMTSTRGQKEMNRGGRGGTQKRGTQRIWPIGVGTPCRGRFHSRAGSDAG